MTNTDLDNIALATFMGYNVRIVDDTSTAARPSYALFSKDGITTDGVYFDCSYDALMGVVEKIESLGYDVVICRSGIQIWKRNVGSSSELIIDEDSYEDYQGKRKFDALYKSLVSFARTYKTN